MVPYWFRKRLGSSEKGLQCHVPLGYLAWVLSLQGSAETILLLVKHAGINNDYISLTRSKQATSEYT